MADTTPESIQKIRIGTQDHPIDAVTLNGKSAETIESESITGSINRVRTDVLTNTLSENDTLHAPTSALMYSLIGEISYLMSLI